jgi:hypothetical protein
MMTPLETAELSITPAWLKLEKGSQTQLAIGYACIASLISDMTTSGVVENGHIVEVGCPSALEIGNRQDGLGSRAGTRISNCSPILGQTWIPARMWAIENRFDCLKQVKLTCWAGYLLLCLNRLFI